LINYAPVYSRSLNTCPARSSETAKRSGEWWQANKKSPGVKVLSGVDSPPDNTFYNIVEADSPNTFFAKFMPKGAF
jgi:hypothetical protein